MALTALGSCYLTFAALGLKWRRTKSEAWLMERSAIDGYYGYSLTAARMYRDIITRHRRNFVLGIVFTAAAIVAWLVLIAVAFSSDVAQEAVMLFEIASAKFLTPTRCGEIKVTPTTLLGLLGSTTFTSTLDGVGNLKSITDPSGTVTYSYDGANRLVSPEPVSDLRHPILNRSV
ncbi:MAG: RHS repeat domain-containing protein [Actinomycetota bacterium]